MKNIDLNYYPGWCRRAISFTIDDGSLKLDKKFIDIVKPAGITGTFNLIPNLINDSNIAAYIEQYSPYEIANHMMYHPMGIKEDFVIQISDDEFNADSADPAYLYKSDREGQYFYTKNGGKRWFYAVTDDKYIELVNEGKRVLEEVFSREIRDFIWPYGRQSNRLARLIEPLGYRSIRGVVYNGFDLPADRANWGFYADCNNMTEKAELYDKLEDDGKLKALIFGVHSHDFENAGKWDVLVDFCQKLGNRPEDFFYGTVGDIFDTEDAINAALVTKNEIVNNSSRDLYIKVDGEKLIVKANGSLKI